MVHGPAHDLQVALASFFQQARSHKVTTNGDLARSDFDCLAERIGNLPFVQQPGHEGWLDGANVQENGRIKRNHDGTCNFARFTQRADQGVFPSPRTGGLQLQIEDHVVLSCKFEDFFDGGNALSGKFASEPRASIQAPEVRKRQVVHRAVSIGGAIHGGVVNGHKARVPGKLQVRFNESGAHS
jgi:hypothetical protein